MYRHDDNNHKILRTLDFLGDELQGELDEDANGIC
jgi:hypothetical protein